jgi:hypothetical protein
MVKGAMESDPEMQEDVLVSDSNYASGGLWLFSLLAEKDTSTAGEARKKQTPIDV